MDAGFVALLAEKLMQGLWMTLLLFAICAVLGNLLAVPIAFARVSGSAYLRSPAYLFILVLRGTPVLVQLYLFYYGVGELLSRMPSLRYSVLWPYLRPAFGYAVIALTLNTAAYCAEIWRGAIQGLPKGQLDAAKSLGFKPWHQGLLVVLPQAFRNALPALSGQNVLLLKATSLASTITIFDVMAAANQVRSQTFRVYESLIGAAVVYVALTSVITLGFWLVERSVNRPHQR